MPGSSAGITDGAGSTVQGADHPSIEAALDILGTGPGADLGRAILRRIDVPSELGDPAAWAASVAEAFAFVSARREVLAIRVLGAGATALDGGRPHGSLVQVASVDRDFIVTSVAEELQRRGVRPARLLSVPFGVERDGSGQVTRVGRARGAAVTESFLEIELTSRVTPTVAGALVEGLTRVLGQVFLATDDYAAMRDLLRGASELTSRNGENVFGAEEVAESVALVDWMLDRHCVMLGAGRFPVDASPDDNVMARVGGLDEESALGLMRVAGTALRRAPTRPPERLLQVLRLPEISAVHRRAPIGRLDLALVDDRGRIDGIARLAFVFTRRAEVSSVESVPLLRWKLRQVLEGQDALPGSYDEQAVTSLFQALPKDELFRAGPAELLGTIRSLLAEDRDHRVRVLMQPQPDVRAVSVLITMPSEHYTRSLRVRLERFLIAQLDGERVDVDLSMGGSSDTVARFLVHLPDGAEAPDDVEAIAREVQLLCRTWEQDIAEALRGSAGDGAGRLASAWSDRLPVSYRDAVDPADAVDDVLALEELSAADPADDLDMRVTLAPLHAPEARLTVASAGQVVELSRLVPIIESLGLWVVDEQHWDVGGMGLHRLAVRTDVGAELSPADGVRISESLLALWRGRAHVDSLNRLVSVAGMTWTDVAVLRAYCRYRRQVDPRYTEVYMDEVLVEHADLTRRISELFNARFGPAGPDRVAVTELSASLADSCDQVSRLDHDRILRGMYLSVSATIRTNLHSRPEGPLALKFDPADVPDMPAPCPYREIFVHGPTVEGVHLRAGPVARGGIRFSDRPQDFRTEVLDLMRTQVLKNALIVPTGAKGGFVLCGAQPKGVDRAGRVRAAYEAFISALLDVTDDIRGDEVVATPGRWDGDDPYLVVAADKGTAAFSDLANRIATDRGFWLGDAFASGGSVGYDHRALGITARGAWVAIERHFHDLGLDLQVDPFTVAGIGDMSGDVFGNGMLLSGQIHLVAAFDHRDIFLDPAPDPASTLVERRRLHELSGSSWQQFDRQLLSAGGGVFSRSLKRIELAPEVRAVLHVTDEALTPAAVIQAILRAPVDLLYLGGVGTYVRASTEADSTIDDRSNSEIRVAANELRARVVGEGANLGFTQRARIEYARKGGRINMDAIDNSAGVDTSDHEVNIKILAALAIDDGRLAEADRPPLLASVTDDVVAAVLADSAAQSDGLSRARDASAEGIEAFADLQATLVERGMVDPGLESLPDDAEYEARLRAGAGLTRPELAVLMAGAKREIKAAVMGSNLPESPAAHDALLGYFPAALADRFGDLLVNHRLRRELISSEIANDLVDHLGLTTAFDLSTELDVGAADVAGAYWVARGVIDGPALWEALGSAPLAARSADPARSPEDAGLLIAALLERLTRRELQLRNRYRLHGKEHDIAARIDEDRPVFVDLQSRLAELDRPQAERERRRLRDRLVADGSAPETAALLAVLPELAVVPDIAALGRMSDQPTGVVAAAFLLVSDELGVDRLLSAVRAAPIVDGWSRAARRGLVDDLVGLRLTATRRALDALGGERKGASSGVPDDAVEVARRWVAVRRHEIDRSAAVLDGLPSSGDAVNPLDALSVAVRALRQAIG